MTNQFKEALDALASPNLRLRPENTSPEQKDADEKYESYKMCAYLYLAENYDTIRLALRIAMKLQEEPSEGMYGVVDEAIDDFYDGTIDASSAHCGGAVFRAMVEQMMREIKE